MMIRARFRARGPECGEVGALDCARTVRRLPPDLRTQYGEQLPASAKRPPLAFGATAAVFSVRYSKATRRHPPAALSGTGTSETPDCAGVSGHGWRGASI